MKSLKCTLVFLTLVLLGSCVSNSSEIDSTPQFYPTSKPLTRWWWFATEITEEDVKHQLDWAKRMNFGGVEIAWVYPLHRFNRLYEQRFNKSFAVDSSAAKWLSAEWIQSVLFTKKYCDSIGLSCDFTFGSSWPVASADIPESMGTKVYGDTSFRQWLTFAWSWPENLLVIDHLDSNAFKLFADPIANALKLPLQGSKSALFTDSWEIKMNNSMKVWTTDFAQTFHDEFGYNILPFMKKDLDSFPDVRYDYMLHLDQRVTEGFYKPYVKKCKELNAWSRVQCLASPTDVMTTYSLVDIPETEALLNNPNYSRIVSSSAALSSRKMVSCESFTCMYGFSSTYLRQENTADLKMVADALFVQGVNQHVYHGMPYNPKGSDSVDFFATTYFGPGGALEPELPAFNSYIEKVSGLMQQGKTYSDVAVYVPYEDAVMKGALPPEQQRVWVWGEYELRYVNPPAELEGHHPIWINRHFLEQAGYENKKLIVGDATFSSLYVDVNYMDYRALKKLLKLAKQGLPVCLKQSLIQPGYTKQADYSKLVDELRSLPNVKRDFKAIQNKKPLIQGDSIPEYWCRVMNDGSHLIFLAQPLSRTVSYPVYSGQSFMGEAVTYKVVFNVDGNEIQRDLVFKPYQSIMLEISSKGTIEELDIGFVPKDPVIRKREMQKSYF